MSSDFGLGTIAGLIAGTALGLLMGRKQQLQVLHDEIMQLRLKIWKLRALEEQNRLMQEQQWGDKREVSSCARKRKASSSLSTLQQTRGCCQNCQLWLWQPLLH